MSKLHLLIPKFTHSLIVSTLTVNKELAGGYSERDTPLTIPNRVVKPLSADGTASSCVGE